MADDKDTPTPLPEAELDAAQGGAKIAPERDGFDLAVKPELTTDTDGIRATNIRVPRIRVPRSGLRKP